MRQRWNELVAVFLAAGATLLFEITATKIFEFSLWANYAYLVISTAMFGLGFSGVILTRWPNLLRVRESVFLPVSTFLSAVTMFLAFLVMNYVPIHLPDAPNGWPTELLHVGVVFFCLGIPFVFFGFVISFLFEHRGEKANVYYFFDLIGAGLGSFLLVPLIPVLEPQGLVVVACLATVAAGLFFMVGTGRRTALNWLILVVGLAGVVWGTTALPAKVRARIPLNVHVPKRRFSKDLAQGLIEKTGWSALSRVDIAPMGADRKRVWIAGGVNESSIVKFDGDFDALRAQREAILPRAEMVLDHKALPHLSKTNHTVCMIGTSGGEDSVYALMLGAREVVGVEMDPMIADFVTQDYRDFAGGIFTDGVHSKLVVDEGRSYLRRTKRTFDVIQQVNNFTPIAFQNGALNLSETYLLTAESFRDFYERLSDDGILAISRYGSIRMLSTAVEMFRRMGMTPEEYSKRLIVCEGSQWVINSMLMKKSPFTREEVDRLFEFYEAGTHTRHILYAPYRTEDLPDLENNLYYKIATADDPSPYWRVGCFDFSPATDSKPFFNRFKRLGHRDRHRERLAMLPGEILHVEPQNKVDRRIPPGDLPPLIILFEALLFSCVFLGLPLISKRELRETLRDNKRALGYFGSLGIAFIFVEICLIQKLVLFLGAPVYSIATVLCSLLVFAGLGSLCSGRIPPTTSAIRKLLLVVAIAVLLLYALTPLLLTLFLGSSLLVRILVSLIFTGGAGFLMGMPMPTGIRYLKARDIHIIPWAWAANGFCTVIGSALSILIAVNFGFLTVFAMATVVYAIAPYFLKPD